MLLAHAMGGANVYPPEVTNRQIILEGDFGGGDAGIQAAFPWQFYRGAGDTSDGTHEITVQDAGQMNGHGSSIVTWPVGSLPSVRFGGDIILPLIGGFENGYPEGWFTYDVKYLSPTPGMMGMKQFGVYGAAHEPPNSNQDPEAYTCADGFACRYMLSGNNAGANPLFAHMYSYVSQIDRDRDNWANGPTIVPDTVARVETYWKINSAFNVADGILQQRYDVGTANAHAEPNTVRYTKQNVYMYCGSEANRQFAGVYFLGCLIFYGGATAAWAPTVNPGRMQFGYLKVEIPA